MMSRSFIAIVAVSAAIVFSSCENPDCSVAGPAEITIDACMEEPSAETRSAISEIVNGAVKFTWLEGDAINMFFGASESSIFVTNTTARVAQFKGTIGAVTGGGDDLNDETSLWGVYPYSSNTTCDGSSITLAVPHVQEAKADNFADDLFPSIARSTNFTMAFYPVCAALRFKVSNPDIVKVTLSGNDNESLAGKANVSMVLGGVPEVDEILEGQKELTMSAPDGGCFETDKYYYFVFYPCDFAKGYTLTYYKEASKATYVKTEAYPVGRNKFGGATKKDAGLTFTQIEDEGGNDGSGSTSVPVQAIYMMTESATLAPGTSYTLDTDYEPYNATNTTWKWSSSDASVAYVDESGKVTAIGDGDATITATATDGSGVSASSTINVIAPAVASVEYKDEYGVNHGYGVAIGDVVWAPVNCGYKAPTVDAQGNVTDKGYPYGKLYQWGRKYGQGYSLEYDLTVPTIVEGSVKASEGNLEANANRFYIVSSSPYDWSSYQNGKLWNSGTEYEPKKTEYDPCPEGWRVPTYKELDALSDNQSKWTSDDGQNGYWFSGDYTYQNGAPQTFFPAAGYRNYNDGDTNNRGNNGNYWCSKPIGSGGYSLLSSYRGLAAMSITTSRALGYSVRCVQE